MRKMDSNLKKSVIAPSGVQCCAEVFDNIMGSVREPLVVLDSDLQVVKANHVFYQTFKIKPDEAEGLLIYDLGCRQWNIPGLKRLLEEMLPEQTECNDFEVEHTFETIGCKILYLNARSIQTLPSQTPLILLAIEDVTDREHQKRDLEELVQVRTLELVQARIEAEIRKETAETALAEIEELHRQLEAERAYLQEEIKLACNHEKIIG